MVQLSSFIISNGHLFACGDNQYGQLGLNDLQDRKIFTQVPSNTIFKSVFNREYHTVALDTEGNLWSCGKNGYGQLGLQDNHDRNILTKINVDTLFKSVSSGFGHTVALDIEGSLWSCVPPNFRGQLGLNHNNNCNILTKIPSGTVFRSVSCGERHTVALDIEGDLWSCCRNSYGQLGLQDNHHRNALTKIPSGTMFRSVSCVDNHTIALDIDGNIWTCGENLYGQLGFNDTVGRNVLTKVPLDFLVNQLTNVTPIEKTKVKGAHTIINL